MRTQPMLCVVCVALASICAGGCATTAGNVALGVGSLSAYGARSPTNELVQIYYLGVLDPTGQLPEAIYRVTVKGQASAMSNMHFASGWVPAAFVDSLTSRISIDPSKPVTEARARLLAADNGDAVTVDAGRKLVLFGPEGFRPAPKDHRLVIVMGASPDKFFEAIDTSLGQIASVEVEETTGPVRTLLLTAIADNRDERLRLTQLKLDAQR